MTTSQFTPGQAVTWMQELRGGYGSIVPVRAEVVRVNALTITIRVWRKETGEPVIRNVKPEHLRQRSTP